MMMSSQASAAIWHRGRSHWFDASASYNPSEPLRGEVRVDCCIIGAGITGLSAAYHLEQLEPSASVALIEAEVVGYGGSGRNAGQLIVSFGRGDHLGVLVRRHGAENIGAAWTYAH